MKRILAIVKNWKFDEKEMIGKFSLILWDQVDKKKRKKKKTATVKNIFLYYSSH